MLVHTLDLPGFTRLASGKVREVFDLGEHLLFVATDRLSAFDCVLPDPIPHKGAVLTALSAFWFDHFAEVPHHLVSMNPVAVAPALAPYAERLAGRSMVVRRARPLPVECVVRGFLAGSGWKEYQRDGTLGGYTLPPGLQLASPLPEPLFTPSTKAVAGHDEPITYARCEELIGAELAARVRALSLRLYTGARDLAARRGLIIADTKFEFGLLGSELILIDEVLTPDSSRFWPAESYRPGVSPPSFDKQFVRDYLETLSWPKTPPAPALPASVIRQTSEKYLQALRQLTGTALA